MKRNRTLRQPRKKPNKPYQGSPKPVGQQKQRADCAEELERELIREASMGQVMDPRITGMIPILLNSKPKRKSEPNLSSALHHGLVPVFGEDGKPLLDENGNNIVKRKP